MMSEIRNNYAVLKKIGFDLPPVGVKCSFFPPEDIPALVHGLHGRQLYPSDTLLIGIPYRWIPTILTNLEKMPLHLEGHKSKAHYYAEFESILTDLAARTQAMET